MRVAFTDARTSKVLWSNDALSFRDEYELATRSNTAIEGVGVPRPGAQLLRPHRHRRRPHASSPPSSKRSDACRRCHRRAAQADRVGRDRAAYLLVGDDDVEKSAVAAEFAEMVDEGLRAFNVDRLYGGETKVDDLIDAANTLPMMAPRRVVVVLEAEKLLIPKRESEGGRGGARSGSRRS